MGRHRKYANATERKRAWRQRQQSQESGTARLIALQETAAQEHLVWHGRLPVLQRDASAEQRAHQAAAKERDMLDALWVLQTLIADFGFEEVERHVLRHLRPLPGDQAAPPPSTP